MRALIVPKGCSTVSRRRRMACGSSSSLLCTASSTGSCSPRVMRRCTAVVQRLFSTQVRHCISPVATQLQPVLDVGVIIIVFQPPAGRAAIDVLFGSWAAVRHNARMLQHCLSKQTLCRRDCGLLERHRSREFSVYSRSASHPDIGRTRRNRHDRFGPALSPDSDRQARRIRYRSRRSADVDRRNRPLAARPGELAVALVVADRFLTRHLRREPIGSARPPTRFCGRY